MKPETILDPILSIPLDQEMVKREDSLTTSKLRDIQLCVQVILQKGTRELVILHEIITRFLIHNFFLEIKNRSVAFPTTLL